MAHFNPLHPQANPALNGNAPNSNPNPHPHPAAAPRAVHNQNQPGDLVEAQIAKRKADKPAPKAKRQKIDAAPPADELKQVRKPKGRKTSAPKRQKASPKDQDIKTVLDLRHRLLQIKKNRTITSKKIDALKPGINDETKLRQYINGIIIREKTTYNAGKRPLKGNPVLATFALKILKNPKDPDYVNAFLYLILKHPEKADEAAQELSKFLDSPDEAAQTRQEEVRFALMKASLKRSQRSLNLIFPQEQLTAFCEKAVVPSLLRIVDQNDFDHPLYDKMIRFIFKYWKSQFDRFQEKHRLNNSTPEEISGYNNNLDTSDWIIPLDFLQKTRKIIDESVTDIGSLKHGLALEIIMTHTRPLHIKYAEHPHTELMTKFFCVPTNLVMPAIEHAIHLLKDQSELTKTEFNLLSRLCQITGNLNPSVHQVKKNIADIVAKYCEALTLKVLDTKEDILNQAQLNQKNRLYAQYKKSLPLLFQALQLHMVAHLPKFLKNTTIDKHDFLMTYLTRNTAVLGSEKDPVSFEFAAIFWENIISKWSLTDFQNFFQQMKTVIPLKSDSLRAQYTILDTIFLYGSDEVRLAHKEELKQYFVKPQSRNFVLHCVSAATIATQQRFAHALTRLYHLGILTEGDAHLLKPYAKSLSPGIYNAMPAVFRETQPMAAARLPVVAAPAQAQQQPRAVQLPPALVEIIVAPPAIPRGSIVMNPNTQGLEPNSKAIHLSNIKIHLRNLKIELTHLYKTPDTAKWPSKIREDLEAFKTDITAQTKETIPLMNEYCIQLSKILDEKASDFKDKLLSLILSMRDHRNNHDLYGNEHKEIIKTLDHIIASIDDEDIKTRAHLTKLSYEDPLDVSGQQLSLLEAKVQMLMETWDQDSTSSKEEFSLSSKRIMHDVIDYIALITSGAPVNKELTDFIHLKLYPALLSIEKLKPLGSSTSGLTRSIRLLESYIGLLTAQTAEPELENTLFKDICITLNRKISQYESADCVNFITYTILLRKQNELTKQKHGTYFSTHVLETIQRFWSHIPWFVQTNIITSSFFMGNNNWRPEPKIARFMFKLSDPYLRRNETPEKLLHIHIDVKLSLLVTNFQRKVVKGGNYEERIALRFAQLYDQFPLSYKRLYTQRCFMGSAPELREQMVQFMLNEFKNPESAQMITHILATVAPSYYLTLLHRFFDRLVETDFKESPVQLNVLREAAKVTIPAVPFEALEIPQHFQDLFDRLNMTDVSKPDFISMSTILGMNNLEFGRSTYKNITRDQMRAKCMRFLKDLINRNLPADRRLNLSPDEQAQKVWLPEPALDAEWMQMISIMMTKIKETENHDQRIYNTAILINGLFVCPTGQASAIETAYGAIVLKKELGSQSFKETMLYLIQESQETALLKALSMPDSIVGHALGNNVHNEQIYRLILKATYGLRQITSYKESSSRITTWADIEKVLRFFKQQWTDDMIISSILKSFGTKEDCEIAYTVGLTDQASALMANKQAKQERPLRILDSHGNSYLDWLMQNNLNPEEYGIILAKDETGDIDLYNFKIEKIEITKEIVVKVLTQLGYWVAG